MGYTGFDSDSRRNEIGATPGNRIFSNGNYTIVRDYTRLSA